MKHWRNLHRPSTPMFCRLSRNLAGCGLIVILVASALAPAPAFAQTGNPEPAKSRNMAPPVSQTPGIPGPGAKTGQRAGALSAGGNTPVANNEPQTDWRHTARAPDAAYGAFQRGYFVTAFKEAMKRIEAGSSDSAAAMTLVAELFKDGLGFRKDPAEAAKWYILAAKRGDREAAFALGRAYMTGEGVKKDRATAIAFLKKAADKGNPAAQYNLGIIAMEPVEDNKTGDFKKAAALFKESSEGGNLDATYALAILYRTGRGVVKDETRATTMLQQAADQHHIDSLTEYAIALFNGRGVKKDEKASARYMIRGAWRNSPLAQNRLARMYVSGRGVQRDMVQAMKWHIIARSSGVKDKWLEDKLPTLTRTQRKVVDEQVRKFAGK